MVSRIVIPKAIHVLIPGTYDHVTLHDRWDFVVVIRLRTLQWEYYPGLCGWAK